VAVVLSGVLVRASAPARTSPSVLLLCFDTLRADQLAPYGGAASVSPHIAAFATDGIVFDNAFSVASWTKPAVASLLTGLYPSQHGVIARSELRADLLPQSTVTLAETLKNAGYRTGAFVENVHLQRAVSAFDQGFDTYREEVGSAREIIDGYAEWIVEEPDRPTFAYLHFLEPHWPYVPTSPEHGPASSLESETVRARWGLDGSRWPLLRDAVNAGRVRVSTRETAALRSLYEAEVVEVDHALGAIIALLRERSLLEQTLVILVSDHGEGFLEHGRLDHGYGPYDELIRIPMIFRFPERSHAGLRLKDQVQISDVTPTVLDVLDLPLDSRGGRSLLGPIEGTTRLPVSESITEEIQGLIETQSIRDGRYKYLRRLSRGGDALRAAVTLPPADLAAGLRVRIEGVGADDAFVSDEIKLVSGGDTDCELQVPVATAELDRERTIDVIGLRGSLPGLDEKDLAEVRRARDAVMSGIVWARLAGTTSDGLFVVRKIEPYFAERREMEIEGVIERVERDVAGTVLHLCGRRVIVDRSAAWKDFASLSSRGDTTQREVETTVREELYDLENDPREQRDVAAVRRAEADRLGRRLDARRAALVAGAAPPRADRIETDAELRERLRALGYTE